MDVNNNELHVLMTHKRDGDSLIELFGPKDIHKSAAVIITVGHGGRFKPSYIKDRSSKGGTALFLSDLYTDEIGFKLASKIIDNYGKVPYLIFNHLHRSKLDVNRDKAAAAQGDAIAEEAWYAYHDFIQLAQSKLRQEFGTLIGKNNNSGRDLEGVKGLLLDLHGAGGNDWQTETNCGNAEDEKILSTGPPPFIHWGYRLTATALNQNSIVDEPKSTFTQASTLPNQDLESLIRGKNSLGSRFYSLVNTSKDVPESEYFGAGLPSQEFPDPLITLSTDRHWIEKKRRIYFNGGYTIIQHEYLDWETRTGQLMMNTVQVELPKPLRFGDGTSENRAILHLDIAHALSITIMSFVSDVFEIPFEMLRPSSL